MKRIPYPPYARYALIAGVASLGGLYTLGLYLNSSRPEHPYKDVIQVCTYVTTILNFPYLVFIYSNLRMFVIEAHTFVLV